MQLRDVAMLSTRMFKTNPARTWLTIAGMGVGTGAVVTLVGLGFGLQNIILEQIVFGETLLSLAVNNPPSKLVQITPQTIKEFGALPNVKDVSPLGSFPALITIDGLSGNTFLEGAEPPFFRYTGAVASAGELFKDGEDLKNKDNVILTQAVLKLFAITDPKKALGKTASFRVFVPQAGSDQSEEVSIDKSYKIVGVTNDANTIAAIVPLGELASHVEIKSYDKAEVRVTESKYLDPTTAAIIKKGFIVTALSKTVDQANKIFQGIQVILAVFGGIALMVSAIGMFNTMTVTLLERTGEIGVMRTLGASSGDIKILFISEAVIVGFLGGIMGILFGLGIGFSLNGAMNVAAANFGGKSVALFAFPISFLLFIASFSAIVGFMTGVFPARRAASLNPLDAIRYK